MTPETESPPESQAEAAGEGLASPLCSRCDCPGGVVTFANQASLPIDGKVQCIDWCIHQIVAALNAGGVETIASCCGHGKQRGRIDLADGRILFIENDQVQPPAGETPQREAGCCCDALLAAILKVRDGLKDEADALRRKLRVNAFMPEPVWEKTERRALTLESVVALIDGAVSSADQGQVTAPESEKS